MVWIRGRPKRLAISFFCSRAFLADSRLGSSCLRPTNSTRQLRAALAAYRINSCTSFVSPELLLILCLFLSLLREFLRLDSSIPLFFPLGIWDLRNLGRKQAAEESLFWGRQRRYGTRDFTLLPFRVGGSYLLGLREFSVYFEGSEFGLGPFINGPLF